MDGTSIDTLEEIARQLGLEAEQVMVPPDHLLLDASQTLPALLMVVLPSGFTHFIVVWRRHGYWVQVMDPGSGRRWLSVQRLLHDTYVHRIEMPAADWLAWAQSDDFLAPLGRRLRDLGLRRRGDMLIHEATAEPGWQRLARLDAATRLVTSLVRGGGVRQGREAERVLRVLLNGTGGRDADAPSKPPDVIPEAYWSVHPATAESDATAEERLSLRGAVLVRVRGPLLKAVTVTEPADAGHAEPDAASDEAEAPTDPDTSFPNSPPDPPLSPELAAALAEPPSRPVRELLRLLRDQGAFSWAALAAGLTVAAGAVVIEALLLRSLIDIGQSLGLMTQRLAAVGYVLLFALALLLVELRTTGALLRLGRQVEVRLRLALLEKIPRLLDQYLRSRPVSDMAERSHLIHQVRLLPRLAGQVLRAVLSLVITAAALAWIYPPGAPIVALAALLAVALPLAFTPHLQELDLRMRTHTGGLTRFYLDALLGLTAVRAHSAERALRREQESLLVEWADAGRRLICFAVALEGLQTFAGFGLAVVLLFHYLRGAGEPTGALLLAYWALYLPILGEEIALLVRQYPIHRNLILRLIEPLGRPRGGCECGPRGHSAGTCARERPLPAAHAGAGVAIAFEGVTVLQGMSSSKGST